VKINDSESLLASHAALIKTLNMMLRIAEDGRKIPAEARTICRLSIDEALRVRTAIERAT
jgi:hypothetical protein